jgi:glycosyltransferase involved in cell wall biosynthesis
MASRPLRLLYITSTARIGGAERRALNLIRFADPETVRPSLLALESGGPLVDEARALGVEVATWKVRGPLPWTLAAMTRALHRGRYDIVQPFGLRAELLARGPASRAGARVVSSICSVDPWRRWYHNAADRITAPGVAAWISNSEAGRTAVLTRGYVPADQVHVVPTGIPDRQAVGGEARLRARRELGIDSRGGPVLVVLANLRRAKGHEDLIEAVVRLRGRWPGLVCICAGRDDSGGALPNRARARGVADAMRFPGFVPDPGELYDAADLAVLASHWEGMPSALVEALRAGLASVATDVGGVSEVVRHEHEGLLVPPCNPAALAEAIERALADPQAREAWGRAARERYEAEFGVERMVRRTQEIHMAVAESREA